MPIILGLMLLLFAMLVVIGVSVSINKTVSGFVNPSESFVVADGEGIVANPQSVPAAQPATLTTHTTNTTGTLTMTNSGHGIVTGQRIDIYWTGGQCYGAVVGTVSGTTVPIASVSGGSNLPASSTAVTIGIATSTGFGLTGDNISALVLSTPQTGYFVFNNGSADVAAKLHQAGRVYTWDLNSPDTNPLAGTTPTRVYMSHNYVTSAVTQMQATAIAH